MKKFKQSMKYLGTSAFIGFLSLLNTVHVYADEVEDVQARLNDAGTQIQGLLTGLIVTVGICVSIFIAIKKMPQVDNPQEKSQIFGSIGRVWALVAVGAATVWLVPWVYSLFQ